MKKETDAQKILELYDQNEAIMAMFAPKTKDFSKLILALECFVEQIKITKEVSRQIKEELGELDDKRFLEEFEKRIKDRIAPLQKEMNLFEDSELSMLFFALPGRKGRKFFEIMRQAEELEKIPRTDSSKKEKVGSLIKEMESYISEIKEINKPFIPAKIDKNRTIIFKVMFKYRKGTWRKIELKSTQTLVDLHEAIQEYFEWDNDHLYSFYMDNQFNRRKGDYDMEYTCPFESEGGKTADIKAGTLEFEKKQKFAYLFDFGDCHRFEIEVVDFGKVEKDKKYPLLVESKGKSPEQYPEYDEE